MGSRADAPRAADLLLHAQEAPAGAGRGAAAEDVIAEQCFSRSVSSPGTLDRSIRFYYGLGHRFSRSLRELPSQGRLSCRAVVRAEYSSPSTMILANFRIAARILFAPFLCSMLGILKESGVAAG